MRKVYVFISILGIALASCGEESSNTAEASRTEEVESSIVASPEDAIEKEDQLVELSTTNVVKEVGDFWLDENLKFLQQDKFELSYGNNQGQRVVKSAMDWLLLPEDFYLSPYNTISEMEETQLYNDISRFSLMNTYQSEDSLINHFGEEHSLDVLLNQVYFDPHPQLSDQTPKNLVTKYKPSEIERNDSSISCTNEMWYEGFELKAQGDFDQDGILDVLFFASEKAKGGTLASSGYFLMTKKAKEGEVSFRPFSNRQIQEQFQFNFAEGIEGKIGKTSFSMSLEFSTSFDVAGEYDYQKGAGAIQLKGFYLSNGFIYLNEFNQGQCTGVFVGKINGDQIEGVWVNPQNNQTTKFNAYGVVVGC